MAFPALSPELPTGGEVRRASLKNCWGAAVFLPGYSLGRGFPLGSFLLLDSLNVIFLNKWRS